MHFKRTMINMCLDILIVYFNSNKIRFTVLCNDHNYGKEHAFSWLNILAFSVLMLSCLLPPWNLCWLTDQLWSMEWLNLLESTEISLWNKCSFDSCDLHQIYIQVILPLSAQTKKTTSEHFIRSSIFPSSRFSVQ